MSPKTKPHHKSRLKNKFSKVMNRNVSAAGERKGGVYREKIPLQALTITII